MHVYIHTCFQIDCFWYVSYLFWMNISTTSWGTLIDKCDHRETGSSPLKMGLPRRKVVSQPPIFKGYVSFREQIQPLTLLLPKRGVRMGYSMLNSPWTAHRQDQRRSDASESPWSQREINWMWHGTRVIKWDPCWGGPNFMPQCMVNFDKKIPYEYWIVHGLGWIHIYTQTGTFADPTVRCFKAFFDLCTFVRFFFGCFKKIFLLATQNQANPGHQGEKRWMGSQHRLHYMLGHV